MPPHDLKPGGAVASGLLYRWVPNTELSFDYRAGRPGKMAFRPREHETGISVFLAELLNPADVIYDLNGYGVCQFTAEALLLEVDRLRSDPANKFTGQITITFEPDSRIPVKGHAHCYIEPMPVLFQKALYRRLARMTEGYLPGPAVAGRRREDIPGG